MTFGEKLFKIRKEKGLSQEALAEKLNTSRQAISKWENGQGYPETEKLLMIGNIFEVSMDYLLKDSVEMNSEKADGYYVSKEMAEGYLIHAPEIAKRVALGISLLILCFVPFLVFKQDPAIYTFLIIIIAMLGIVMLVSAGVKEEAKYEILRKEILLLDENYLKELTTRYENLKKKYAFVMGVGICFIIAGALALLLERKDIALGVLVPYFPVFTVFIAVGAYILFRTTMVLEAYKLLVKNEEYVNRLGFKLKKKVHKKVDEI
ncbi:transcriptional regulator [Virgibacillus indicus]|uniref:Transcriptional regulator n=1 Tax=Virgibacillus indicus TaxID=2024554 RepID=A0A265NC82_9BACI|nr:helix-turn-helix transcriptional regulator [Virgibacillus indicus]OZU89427.1 transcriptional regulator [Virgibacillus indicus]